MKMAQCKQLGTNFACWEEGLHLSLKWHFVFSVPNAIIIQWLTVLLKHCSLVALWVVGSENVPIKNAHYGVWMYSDLYWTPDTRLHMWRVCLPFPGSNLLPLPPRHKEVKRHFTASAHICSRTLTCALSQTHVQNLIQHTRKSPSVILYCSTCM